MAYETKYECRKAAREWVKDVLSHINLEPDTDWLKGFNAGIAHAIEVVEEKINMDERNKEKWDE